MATKYIMIQGCTSNAGKTTLCAALCRIFKEDGYKVAPFKAQNMGLNSYIDRSGGELGYGQALQAFASKIEPRAWMNPILLKPVGNGAIDIYFNGEFDKRVTGNEFKYKKQEYLDNAINILKANTKDFDIVVLEGAGSPAEINIERPDIANMGLASALNSSVLIVGNIELGGVFASIYGTYSLLEENEQSLIRGFIINKLHGYASLLDSGINKIEEKLGIKGVGVIPYCDLDLEDEDLTNVSVIDNDALIKIAILKSPYATNLNMFKELSYYRNVSVAIINKLDNLSCYDALIIPQSANNDIDALFFNGLDYKNYCVYSANDMYVNCNIYDDNMIIDIATRKGLDAQLVSKIEELEEVREKEIQKLAQLVRENIDLEYVYNLMGI